MPTRFYFPADEVAAVSPTISAEWEHINTLRRRLLITPDSSALITVDYSPDGADHLVDGDAHHRQYVSDPILAQTIAAQTVSSQFQIIENHAGNNLFFTVKIFVCSNDGATIKETLLAISRDALEATTSLVNRSFSATTISAAVEDGDRIVVELGLGGTPTAATGVQGHNGDLRWGCDAAGGDLPVDDTSTGTTLRPWLEFANAITFLDTEMTGERTTHRRVWGRMWGRMN